MDLKWLENKQPTSVLPYTRAAVAAAVVVVLTRGFDESSKNNFNLIFSLFLHLLRERV